MLPILETPIEYLKGVGPQRGEVLRKEAGIFTFFDLLRYFPFRYINRSHFHSVKEIPFVEGFVQLKGTISMVQVVGAGRGKRLNAKFTDSSGSIDLVWFQGAKYVQGMLDPRKTYILFGKAKNYASKWSIPHPELEVLDETVTTNKQLQPVYHSGEKMTAKGLHSKGVEKLIVALFEQLGNAYLPEIYSDKFLSGLGMLRLNEAYRQIHFPTTLELADKARLRMKFDELFFLQMELILRKEIGKKKNKSFVFGEVGSTFLEFYEKHLPFPLTNAQKRVIKEIRADFQTGTQANRLLQGDVGSGKTVVALLTMLIAVGNGYQAALMAPTEILANQHFLSLSEMVREMPIRIELLTGSTKTKERKRIHEGLENGEVHILVGTHALLEPKVKFKNLGFAVIDEQHRFGVAQRARLWQKNTFPPHILVMTATPIPRTLAMTFYGDLDVSVIDELPPGRKPVTTVHYFESQHLKVFGFIAKEIEKGRQVYIVYPLISESETLDYQNLMQGYESLTRRFPLPDYRVSVVHGQMKAEDKDFEMARFVRGETQLMVATTVIEVGVNVPNASVMIIESSERFGLSQLHQLRGRVGRGAEQSYCILMTGNKLSQDAKTRLSTMCSTNDGFEIAQVDLELRGPGDIMGTQQSGLLNLQIADLAKDGQILTLARQKAFELIEADSMLQLPENSSVRSILNKKLAGKPNWSKIS
jgi:ATP-dependent DNA helicase RecG